MIRGPLNRTENKQRRDTFGYGADVIRLFLIPAGLFDS